ncbi:GerAB/ArcD/ProY family transporter [Paenibacillus sp. 32352]|uniref:GerAB/ArcD/ProY family transporter n=1 Tax=Paenibacillus TaxID=44249 RepID=UPI0009AE312F|nr:GerAB/ArcD/ProY family transporter [Paenibacillus sp. 32352]
MASRVGSAGLFSISAPFGFLSLAFWANRMQTLYYLLYLPSVLAEPVMIGLILLAAGCSHLNILMIARCFAWKETPGGYLGIVRTLGSAVSFLFLLAGLFAVLMKGIVLMMGYVDIVHHILFPALHATLFGILLLCACVYLARLGMEKTVRFAIVAFVGTIWVTFLYVPFAFPPAAEYRHLLPLLPEHMPKGDWQTFLTIWAAFSGPEYMLALPKEAVDAKKLKTALISANAFTAFEYIFFFVICLTFYGSDYLQRQDLPIVDLIRYIQLPFAERLEMILIPAYAISVVYVVAILLLYAAGAIQCLARSRLSAGRAPFWLAFLMMLLLTWMAGRWIWPDEWKAKEWITWLSWLDASTYTVLPFGFFLLGWIMIRRKWRDRHAGGSS